MYVCFQGGSRPVKKRTPTEDQESDTSQPEEKKKNGILPITCFSELFSSLIQTMMVSGCPLFLQLLVLGGVMKLNSHTTQS